MKAIIFSILCISVMACTSKKELPSMPGVYTLTSQKIKSADKDTTYTTLKLMKIYTGDHYMYAGVDPSGSIGFFGIGTYNTEPGMLTEHNIFNAAGSVINSNPEAAKLLIEKNDKGYTQKNSDTAAQAQTYEITESYEAMPSTTVSALDGAWKEAQFYSVKGRDTAYTPAAMARTEYKVFYLGHVVFGISFKDNTQKQVSVVGYGVFSSEKDNKIKQVISTSNNPQIVDPNGLIVDIEMPGPDEFRQITNNPDGTKYVSVFKRVK